LVSGQHTAEVNSGERFEFGKNWLAFLRSVTEERIEEAMRSLVEMLERPDLRGMRFLDIGSGSGLFSLAARRLGARVHSFDFDPDSVACTREIRGRFCADDAEWTVEQGSVLDEAYLASLGQFDIVYSWGVLHHTGQMWRALGNAAGMVREGGLLYIAIYNDQGGPSRRWLWVKRTYNQVPWLRWPLLLGSSWRLLWKSMLKDLLLLRPGHTFREYKRNRRGMSYWHDIKDWVGGYPFEVAKAEEIFDFHRARGFVLTKLITDNNLGCNQFVFRKTVRAI
jgi:2-polyprenyl-6-hydroxyphenyl methylase/3-demethylubiquinone-9 3-methyltransferase